MKDGIVNIYKDKGMTSFDVVAKLRSALKIKKIGHTGTLDPDATGVLPICIGKATKLVELLSGTDKAYRAVMLLGKRTDTQDISGTVLEEGEFSPSMIKEKLPSAMAQLSGSILQVPPMYSALKVGGVKLVDAARRGQTIERKPRPVTIYSYENVTFSSDGCRISFDVRCSKGTYIRTLCEDLGTLMGVPACLEELERTEASGLSVQDALPLSRAVELAKAGQLEPYLLPIDSFLTEYEALTVNAQGLKKTLVGNFLTEEDLADGLIHGEQPFRIYAEDGRFLALYQLHSQTGLLKPEKMFL